jgi:predicted molibdopterin-dependent oxidoreductase YjgC
VKRRPAVVYNPADFKALQVPKGIMNLPFANLVNPKTASNLGPMGMCKMVSNPDLKCLYLIGEVPHLARRYEAVIVQDIFAPAIEFDVFLPAAAPGEFDGSFTGMDGRRVKCAKVTEPVGLARPDQWIINEMVKRLGPIGLVSAPELVFRPPAAIARKRSDKYRFNLLVRENCYRFRSFVLSAKIKGFDRLRHDRALWVNPKDARRLRLETGQEVQLQGEALSHKIQVYVTNRVPEGTVFTYRDPSAGLIRNQPVAVRKTGSKP